MVVKGSRLHCRAKEAFYHQAYLYALMLQAGYSGRVDLDGLVINLAALNQVNTGMLRCHFGCDNLTVFNGGACRFVLIFQHLIDLFGVDCQHDEDEQDLESGEKHV